MNISSQAPLALLRRKFRVPRALLAEVEAESRLLEVIPAQTEAPSLPIRDKDDPWIIACALQASVDGFVTGDAELLTLGKVGGLRIVSPRTCWEMCG